jgi:hypothetical protein|tara:strand:+ start:56 stop:175 length:120 start_codon:yes stop_codon:yes gene_type:complete
MPVNTIHLGAATNTQPSAFYVGGETISEIYLGTVQVFGP